MAERYSNLRRLQMMLVVVTCLSFIQTAFAAYEFDIYRLVAFEQNGKPFGSKISSLSLVGSHFSGELLRKLALINFAEITAENIDEILSKKPSGLLLILPSGQSQADEANGWKVVSEKLVNKNIQIPVYFCEENDVIQHIYDKSKASITKEKSERHRGIDSSMNFIVNAAEPKLIRFLALEDFYGVLDENTPLSRISATSNPIILVVASYDSLTFAPDSKLGFNEFSSGAVALLNVAKTLSEFFSTHKDTNYNVLFFLTSSRSFNYEGFELWLNKAENSRIVNKVEYAVLLDSVSSTRSLNLFLYNGDQGDHETAQNTVKNFEKVGQTYGVPVQFHQANSVLFNKKFPVLKVTDASSENSRNWIARLFDLHKYILIITSNFNNEAFKRNVELVSEFLISSIYNVGKTFKVLDTHHFNQEFLNASLSLFEARSTFPPNIVKDSPLPQELYKVFSEVAKHPSRNTYTYSTPQFYSTAKAKLKITRINSAFFDLYLLVGNLAWLSVLYLILNQTKKPDDVVRPRVEEAKKLKTEDGKTGKSAKRRE